MSRTRIAFATALFAVTVALPATVSAQFSVYTGNVGGFVSNSATAAFTSAAGTLEHRDFDTDQFGAALPSGPVAGSIFSPTFTLSTRTSGYGGTTGTLINSSSSEVGPYSNWGGMLVIDFLSTGNLATAVGFGTVVLGSAGTINVFDETGALAYSTTGAAIGNDAFDFFGAVATGSQRVSRVELDGSFYAIQDISVSTVSSVVATPEPASLVLFGTGLGALAFVRRRRNA